MRTEQATRIRQQLDTALAALYRQFAGPPPAQIEGCPCCIGKRHVDVLLATPLRELTGQALWGYVSGLFYTVGSVADFRYLLPRILDVSANDLGDANNPEIVLRKLKLAKWQKWSEADQTVVRNVLDAWFEQALCADLADADQGYIGWDAEAVLCGAALAGLDVGPWLRRLQAADVAPVLADMRQRRPKSLSGFWEDAPDAYREFEAMLMTVRD